MLALALVSGVGFGLYFVFLARAGDDSGLWPLVISRVASADRDRPARDAAAGGRAHPRPRPGHRVLAGACDALANMAFLLATREGLLSLASVLTALYPAVTVLLAVVVLREHTSRTQRVGLALAAAVGRADNRVVMDVGAWIERYERLWRTAGTDDLSSLFTVDATYRMSPWEDPVVGLPAIAELWEDEREDADEPFTHVLRGRSRWTASSAVVRVGRRLPRDRQPLARSVGPRVRRRRAVRRLRGVAVRARAAGRARLTLWRAGRT